MNATGRPRLGFLGVGWIGRMRMEAILGHATVAAIADPSREMREAAAALAPDAQLFDSMQGLLDDDELDGVVIATPSSLHADQAIAFLERGIPVFCQKPLGRDFAENQRVVECAAKQDRLLGVDLSYRHTSALMALHGLITGGELGDIFEMELVFHNAYGPDKAWFRQKSLAGGGCVMDLGIHLVDAALWMLGFPRIGAVHSRLLVAGRPAGPDEVEDYAYASFEAGGRTAIRLACSWNLPAGRDAIIEVRAFGTRGGAAFRNVDGSFYDFVAERYRGTSTEPLVSPPDAWGGRALLAWIERLRESERFDPEIRRILDVAKVLDAIYGR